VLHTRKARSYDRNIWVGALGRRGAYCLVGAAGAVICKAGLLRFGTGAVFYDVLLGAVQCIERLDICHKGGVAGRNVPGSGATSCGAALRGASKSTCVGSSSEGAILFEEEKSKVATWLCVEEWERQLANQEPP
jgi:hypothetical protein